MSPLMIILLILILTIRFSYQNDTKKYKTEIINNLQVEDHQNSSILDRLNKKTMKVMKNDQVSTSLRSNKLRHDLLHLMSAMVKKIINQRRLKESRKMGIRRKVKNDYLDKMANDNKMSIGEYPVDNDLEHGEQIGRDRKDSKTLISRDDRGIRKTMWKYLSGVSETPMPLIRRFSTSLMREVRGNSSRPRMRINSFNGNETRMNLRGKRQSESDVWIKKDFKDQDKRLKMHALVVKDEDIPPCCSPAKQVTDQRYFMCSGAVLTLKHAISTASCLHFADVFEHSIDADLAILIGATDPRAYVIKINRYDMHPNYEYDVEAKNHATNNLAIIYLACSIVPEDAIVPSLPKGINDDVGHMCCREGCDVVTIVESAANRHIARIIKARNLPAPKHEDDVPNFRQISNVPMSRFNDRVLRPNENNSPARRIGRSPSRLAAAPIFFGKEPRGTWNEQSSERSAGKRRRKSKTLTTPRAKSHQQRLGRKKKPLNLEDLLDDEKSKGPQIPILRALEQEGVNIEGELAAVDWQQIEETMANKFSEQNRATMEVFAKDVVDETMRRLDMVLGDDENNGNSGTSPVSNGSSIFGKLMKINSKNKTIESFVEVFADVVMSLVPPSNTRGISVSSDASLEAKDLEDPPPIYEECPPLGAPVITDGILVGLLAYTCDDDQSWVEWKYVNIARNMNWIRKQIAIVYEPDKKCSEMEKFSRSLREDEKHFDNDQTDWKGNLTNFRDIKAEWMRDNERSWNFENSKIVETETPGRIYKDSWLARNSQTVPQTRTNERIFLNSRNRAKPSIQRHVPVYNVNTCYVKEDGSTDCQTSAEFLAR